MLNLLPTLKGIIFLDESVYEGVLSRSNPMKLGLFALLICFFVAALPSFLTSTINNSQPFTSEKAADFQSDFLQGFDQAAPFLPQDEDFEIFIEQFKQNFAMGTGIAVAIDALPTPLPRAIGGFLQALGGWISDPFNHLASFLAYAIWVLLFAKLWGGRGGVNAFLGLTALYAVPNLLAFFRFIPFVGGLVALIGMIWGWVVYVKAVQVSQEYSTMKAILISILPVIVMVIIASFMAIFVTVGFIILAVRA